MVAIRRNSLGSSSKGSGCAHTARVSLASRQPMAHHCRTSRFTSQRPGAGSCRQEQRVGQKSLRGLPASRGCEQSRMISQGDRPRSQVMTPSKPTMAPRLAPRNTVTAQGSELSSSPAPAAPAQTGAEYVVCTYTIPSLSLTLTLCSPAP